MSDHEDGSGSEIFSFVQAEHEALEFWRAENIFQRSLEQTKDGPPYIFYDGPPFATGLPHHGHLVASTLKDIIPRYYTMQGFHVQRRFGWDCHGLPIEHEIDKSLGMSSIQAVAELGLKGYNDACRGIVQRYTAEWEKTITRIGRWVDFENDYKTMDPWYMESVWWVIKQLWDQGLIYRGINVVPFSTALGTVLSNFEAGSNYQEVQDPAITVLFKLRDEDACMSAWTTTPWTLPSNLSLCVNAKVVYLKVRDPALATPFYLAKERLDAVGKRRSLEVLSEHWGSEFLGRKYHPLFPYFADLEAEGAFQILADDYVTTDAGTGIVHQAPAFGEDDFRVMKSHGFSAIVCPVDMEGKFTAEVGDFAGQYVKDADKGIIRRLKEEGKLYLQEVHNHSYPFCPRSDTPIIYRTIPSWYVKVEQLRERLAACNRQINWVPQHIRDGRMGNWLDNAIDWCISRNRYWGTPLPIWMNDASGNCLCIGSIAELEEYSGQRVEDLHRENVDHISFQVEGEEGTYRRVEEVLDCWFESGSMPYAQLHYPFENRELFEAGFPAQYIAEGLDQTRGWFYTLLVLSTALYDKPSFKNVIVNGIVMAEDGKKMSKRLQNYTPPDQLMEQYGADALRLYLINSGLVKAEEQRFSDKGVRDMVRRALLPWYNAFRFFQTYAEIDGLHRRAPEEWKLRLHFRDQKDGTGDDVEQKGHFSPVNITDQWILSRLQSLKARVAREMAGYRLYNVVPALFAFIEDLTNWHIRLNRARFWGEGLPADKRDAYQTLFQVLHELALSMAPFAPFLAEHIYRQLAAFRPQGDAEPPSVHLCPYPKALEALRQPALEQAVARMQDVILLGRQKRNQERIKTKIPLAVLTIIHADQSLLDEIRRLEDYVKTELNVKAIVYSSAEEDYVRFYAKPNYPLLGKRLGKDFRRYQQGIAQLKHRQLRQLQEQGELVLDGERFSEEEIQVFKEARPGADTLSNRFIAIELDCTVSPELAAEGLAREVVNRIQKTRKDMGLHVADRIHVDYLAEAELGAAMERHQDYIGRETLCTRLRPRAASGAGSSAAGREAPHSEKHGDEDPAPFDFDIEGHPLTLYIRKQP